MLINKENHIGIETIRWELNVSSVENAIDWQERASAFTRDKIGTILEETFIPYASKYHLLELDHLEICLSGSITEENLEEEIRAALTKKLREMNNSFHYDKQNIFDKGNMISGNSIIFQLEQYLKTGFSSLSGATYSLHDPTLYFNALLQMPYDALRKWIAERMEVPESGIRLVEYFSTDQLDNLFLTLFPGQNYIVQTIHLINKLITATKISIPKVINRFHQFRLYFFKHLTSETDYFIKWWQEVEAFGFVGAMERAMVLDYITGFDRIYDSNSSVQFSDTEVLVLMNVRSIEHSQIRNSIMEEGSKASDNKIRGVEKAGNTDFIQNAGAILLYPYLKGIFNDKGWLNTQNEFLNSSFQLEASYLLQFIITGNSEVKEYELMLTKLLCGYPSEAPITRNWNPELASLDAANAILQELIGKWPRLGNTSPEGLRNSFLLRPGKLKEEENNWILWVERRGWDILMESLSYPISIIKLPWMVKPLFVQW